jgi:hypothetical protein
MASTAARGVVRASVPAAYGDKAFVLASDGYP